MRRLISALTLIGTAVSSPAFALDGSISVVHTHGFTDGEIYDSGLALRLSDNIAFGGNELRGEARLRWNSSRCATASSVQNCNVDPLQFDWRELYVSRNVGDWQLSAGLQQVVWGRADNLRVIDVVNPIDLRDFLLPDFNESRMSSEMVRATGPAGNWNFEAIWLPSFKPTRLAAEGTPYDLGINADFRSSGLQPLPSQRPSQHGDRGEFAFRAATTRGTLDADIIAFSGYNDDAAYVLDLSDPNTLGVRPSYRRHSLVGASVALAFDSGWVLRGDATWSPDMPYSNLVGKDPLRAGTYNVLLGLDYQWRDWLFSGQINDRAISGWKPQMATPKHAAIVTFSATGSSHQGRLSHRLAWTAMPQYGDGNWLQWRSAWQFDDHLQIEANLDLINGREAGFLGQFHERDRLRLELRYQF